MERPDPEPKARKRGGVPEGGPADPARAALARISVVLVEPAGPRNIGSTARAMKNFGLGRLVIVGGPALDHPECREMAAGAIDLLESARRCDRIEDAVRDAALVVGTTARARHRIPVKPPTEGAAEILDMAAAGEVALLFGREAHGLSKDEMSLCQLVLNVETSPDYASLNLAQAVLLVAYEVWRASRARGAIAQGIVGRFLSAEWRKILEDELYLALEKVGAVSEGTKAGYRDSLTRVLTAGPIQTRDARVLFALARHAQKVADPADPGARPPRPPRPRPPRLQSPRRRSGND